MTDMIKEALKYVGNYEFWTSLAPYIDEKRSGEIYAMLYNFLASNCKDDKFADLAYALFFELCRIVAIQFKLVKSD